MKLILRFLKPHWKLFLLTVFLLIVDVAGALIIPTLASEMLRQGETGVEMQVLINTAIAMAVAAVISGAGGIMSGYVCAELVSRIAKDMRDALYKKTLDLAVSDFRTFGVASMTTRTVSDVTNIQFALMASIQMVLPVPVVFVISLILAFMKDWMMGLILLAVLAVITVVALLIMRSASPLFRKLQKLLDRMSTVLLENITGVRVVRAFNKEEHEHQRLDTSFSDYAVTSINCCFTTADHALDAEQRRAGMEVANPIRVGNDVWIGAGTTVLAGAAIGDGTVIGAGSVVKGNIPAGVLAAGVPCRVLRKITEEDKRRYPTVSG